MTEVARIGSWAGPAGAAEVRPIAIDELSCVRYIHAASFRMRAGQHYAPSEIEAFAEHVYGPTYTDALAEVVRQQLLYGAWLEGELVGTAGWSAARDGEVAARLRFIFVRPLFTGLGLGGRLLLETEDQARQAGFRTFNARATLNATDFFERFGYQRLGSGVRPLSSTRALPVAFMRKKDTDVAVRHEEAGPASWPGLPWSTD
jgi:GNAT superfamily N-acetyltransferase